MSEDSPKFVSLETSIELSVFPSEVDRSSDSDRLSEADFPSEADLPSHAHSLSQTRVPPLEGSPASEVRRTDQERFVSRPAEDAVNGRAIEVANEPVRGNAHGGTATVTEFPMRAQMPAAVAFSSLEPGSVSLVELIERHGGFDWREAVAVIHQICLYLREHSPQAPILLDPRMIQVTDKGEVRLLSGQTSSDPLVIQVGRLLRTMLMGREAPPELRLLLAQATFELPIFESIDDVDRALAQLNRLDEPGPAGVALLRAVAAPPALPNPDDELGHPPPIRSILPKRDAKRRSRNRKTLGSLFGSYASHVAVIFLAIAAIGGILLTRPSFLFPATAPATTPITSTAPAPVEIATAAPAEAPAATDALASNGPAGPAPVRRPSPLAPDRAGVVVATPPEGRATAGGDPPRPASNPVRPTSTIGIGPGLSAEDSRRRASSLLELGQREEASRAFDLLVASNPFYEPARTELSPEALATFRTSQKQLLPGIVQRDYDRAQAALEAGDADRALVLSREALSLIDRRIADIPTQLRQQVADVVEAASAKVAAQNEILYTGADRDVVPPQELNRQMPLTGPAGVPANRVGWLEMIIGRDGTVENVKLHTPLNRYHERIIVSAAKAWRYRPATRAGRPVRYRINVKVSLPESGTDF